MNRFILILLMLVKNLEKYFYFKETLRNLVSSDSAEVVRVLTNALWK